MALEFNIFSLLVFGISVIALPLIFMKFIPPESAAKNPGFGFAIGGFFILLGFIVAFFIFSSSFSMAILAFGSLFILPFLVLILHSYTKDRPREQATTQNFTAKSFTSIIKKHEKLMTFYLMLFFGMAMIYAILFSVLPTEISQPAFSQQLALFGAGPAGNFTLPYAEILINNLILVFVAFALSIFYGAGSIFVLSYNASIAGVMYGAPLKVMIYGNTAVAPFYANLMSYIPHTIVEIMAYLLAAVAGGILVSRREEDILEATFLFCIAIALIFFGYYLEITIPGSF
ncbi:MAG: hypothetical protein HZB65_01395 [Candidatus Aenigmarchaeota archaeon]|nr:hypothetical protein [Candidatus Aenigmarchaeota archaeon]